MRVCHVAMADLWAGAEVQLAILLRSLVKRPDLEVSAILFNSGWLAGGLERRRVPTLVIREAERNPVAIVRDCGSARRADRRSPHPQVQGQHPERTGLDRAGGPYQVRTIHGAREPFVGVPPSG
jgi:hypothetical protein